MHTDTWAFRLFAFVKLLKNMHLKSDQIHLKVQNFTVQFLLWHRLLSLYRHFLHSCDLNFFFCFFHLQCSFYRTHSASDLIIKCTLYNVYTCTRRTHTHNQRSSTFIHSHTFAMCSYNGSGLGVCRAMYIDVLKIFYLHIHCNVNLQLIKWYTVG